MFCSRWAFIDLSAGPFSWGPAVGGEGVRTEASLPNVEKTIGSASGSNCVWFFICARACVLFIVVAVVILLSIGYYQAKHCHFVYIKQK